MSPVELITFLALGAATGLLSGLLGLGGGVFMVPALYFIFEYMGFEHENLMHLVIGTSLATMVANSAISTWSHHKKKAVTWSMTKHLLPGCIIGCIVGVATAEFLPSEFLARIFGVIITLISLYYLIPNIPQFSIHNPSTTTLTVSGGALGFLSSLLGIGGGTIAVPLLISFKMHVRNAVATSSSFTFFTSLIGTIGYLSIGWRESFFPNSFGFIYLPAFLVMTVGSMLFAPLGVKLAHFLPSKALKLIYSIVLCLIGVTMIFS